MASTSKRDQWLTRQGLMDEFNTWLETDETDSNLSHGITYTSEQKKSYKPYIQVMRFMKDHKKRNEWPTHDEVAGGRSRKRRQQFRGKKSRSRGKKSRSRR